MLNKADVRFHVQWELERIIARSKLVDWHDFLVEDLTKLGGNAAESMARVREVYQTVLARKGGAGGIDITASEIVQERKARMLTEVDREEVSIRADDKRGLGNDSVDWPYGGRISYSVIVRPVSLQSDDCIRMNRPCSPEPILASSSRYLSSDGPVDPPDNPFSPANSTRDLPRSLEDLPFSMSLRAPDMPGKSFRLARRFGSRRILTFRLKHCGGEDRKRVFQLFMGRLFVLFGRGFRAIWAAPDREAVIAIEVGDDLEGIIFRNHKVPDPVMPSFEGLMASGSLFHHGL